MDRRDAGAWVVGITVAAALFIWQGRVGFSLWDEGFLWYGVQRVMAGEVPIRDFMAYDPGRYYMSAAIMGLWGSSGIVALRIVLAIVQGVGLSIALLLLTRQTSRPGIAWWVVVTAIIAVWMFPRHKLFDVSVSIALVGILAFLAERPSPHRYFLTGLCVGIAALFGRNHGVYGVVGSLGVMAFLAIGRDASHGAGKGFLIWAAGVAAGYLPVFVMLAFIPGFAPSFWESVRFLMETQSTNLPLPVPWPWRVPFGELGLLQSVRGILVGLFFIAIAVFTAASVVWAVRERVRRRPVSPTLIASGFLGVPYAHFAFSRADLGHLAQGIAPFLLGSLALISSLPSKPKWWLAGLLCTISLVVALPQHPGWQCLKKTKCVDVAVAESQVRVDRGTAADLAMLGQLAERFAPGNGSFVAVPFWPGAYAALERRSPMWEIYALFPRGEAFQQAEIKRIKAADPGFVLVYDIPVDGREELRFRNTHPLIDQYVRENFTPVSGITGNSAYLIYRSKQVD